MRESSASKHQIPPILVSIPQAAAALGRGTTKIYELIGSGEIVAKKSDGRTLVDYESLREYAKNLPPAVVAARPQRKPQRLRHVGNSAQDQDSETQRWRVFVSHSAQDQDREWVKTLAAEAADVRRQLAETHMSERERVSKNAYVQILVLLPQLSDAELKQFQARKFLPTR
jgi:hypothetical protein